MYNELVLIEEVFYIPILLCFIIAPLVIYLHIFLPLACFLITKDDSILRTVKEFIGFAAIFGGIYWYTLDPTTKKAIKLAALSADVKLTEEGLSYSPVRGFPVSLVVTSREGKLAVGIRVGGRADSYRVHNRALGKIDV